MREQQQRNARRTAMWVGAIAVLVYASFISVAFADWNLISSIGAFGMFVTPFMMAAILLSSLRNGPKAEARCWEGARGLEWTVPSPAPAHTFTTPPTIHPGDLAHDDTAH